MNFIRISQFWIRASSRKGEGFSTLEALLAVAVLTLSISAASLLIFGSQAFAVDTFTNTDALSTAVSLLEGARADAAANFGSVINSGPTLVNGYTNSLTIHENGQCEKWATGTVAWNVGRPQTVSLVTDLSDPELALALGGDCGAPPGGGPPPGGGGCPNCPTWEKPRLFASYKFNPGQPVSLDVLDGVVYVSDDKNKLNIVDTSGLTFGMSGDFLSPPYDAGKQLSDVDAVKWIDPATGAIKRYVYAARSHASCDSSDTTGQLYVIEVTNPSTPIFRKSLDLAGAMPPSGSCPGGWRAYYFDAHVYITTRFTAGHEFHVFDATDPINLTESGVGSMQASSTINDFVAIQTSLAGIPHTVVFAAASASKREIMVIDVSNPTPKLIASVDLDDSGGAKDGLAMYVIGNRLYAGREETSTGPEFSVFDIAYGTDPINGKFVVNLTQLGTAETGADINSVRVFGKFAFLATAKANDEFQVWDISNPALGITRIDMSPVNLPNKIIGGMDYEDPYIYVGSQATNPLQILYSAL